MPPRTQAALLEAMEERQVTIDGTSHPLSPSFTTFATQNPVEFEGTYPLPEAELDRFLVKIRIDYPDRLRTKRRRSSSGTIAASMPRAPDRDRPRAALPVGRSPARAGDVAAVDVEPPLFTYIAALARRTRDWPALTLGASPRACHQSACSWPRRSPRWTAAITCCPTTSRRRRRRCSAIDWCSSPRPTSRALTADQVVADILAAVEVPK